MVFLDHFSTSSTCLEMQKAENHCCTVICLVVSRAIGCITQTVLYIHILQNKLVMAA